MASLNKVILIGNLGNDPEVREFDGRKVANFSVATNERYTKRDGSVSERTQWFRVSFWGKTAETVERYLKKGSQVYVEGRLSTSEYTDQNGEKRFSLEVSGQTMTMLGRAEEGGVYTGGSTSGTNETQQQVESYNPTGAEAEDDLPF